VARYRTIKPEFWTSEQIVECSPIARLLFVGLWNFCDDGGVHPYSVKRIKMEVFPSDAIEIEPLIEELIRVGLLHDYTVRGKRFLYVTGWRHQKIEKPTYRYPRPEGWESMEDHCPQFDDASESGRRHIDDASVRERKGTEANEGNGTNGVETKGNERTGRGDRRPLNDFSDVDWDEVARQACVLDSKIPAKCRQDALDFCRIAVLLQTTFAEDWLQDALHSMKIQKPGKPHAYLIGTLQSKAAEQGIPDLSAAMKKIRIRDNVLKENFDERVLAKVQAS